MYKKYFKRVLDFCGALLGLILLSPLLLAVMVWLHFANKGAGVFFSQERPGKNGRIFKVLKFKSMTDKRGPDGKLLPNEERVTKAGAFIRKTSLDELPQLVNVLKGEMSFVGPRPLPIRYLELYNAEQARRHNVRPGITGWAQINGRNNISWVKKFQLDVFYIDNISLFLDIKILFLTAIKVITRFDINTGDNKVGAIGFKGNVYKTAMVLAGGNDQIELIKALRKRCDGVKIILIDIAKNVCAAQFVDKHIIVSTMDLEAVLKTAKDENIDIIIVACGDQPLITMTYVSEKLGLPCYLNYNQSLNLINKIKMKDLMIKSGIPTAKYKRLDINERIDSFGLLFPVVIKPVDNNGSKGVVKVYNKKEIESAFVEAKKYSISGDILIEEYKNGEEYSVEAFIFNKKPYIIIVTKNIKIKNNNHFTIVQNEYINNSSDSFKNKVLKIVSKIGKAFGINNVPLLIQMIVDGDDINVIEFSARTGGGSKLSLIREMVQVDVIENLLDITEGKRPNITTKPSKQFATINYVYTKPGVLTAFKNLNELIKSGYISDFYQYKTFGTQIKSSHYSSDRPCGFLVKADTREEMKEKIRYIDRIFQVLNESGDDIMRHGIYEIS